MKTLITYLNTLGSLHSTALHIDMGTVKCHLNKIWFVFNSILYTCSLNHLDNLAVLTGWCHCPSERVDALLVRYTLVLVLDLLDLVLVCGLLYCFGVLINRLGVARAVLQTLVEEFSKKKHFKTRCSVTLLLETLRDSDFLAGLLYKHYLNSFIV